MRQFEALRIVDPLVAKLQGVDLEELEEGAPVRGDIRRDGY